jgi:hypothetical protein
MVAQKQKYGAAEAAAHVVALPIAQSLISPNPF